MEYFPDVPSKIPYQPDATDDNPLVFRHYNASEVLLGKSMAEWLKFSVCFWHTFRGTGADPFGLSMPNTLQRPWENDQEDPMTVAKRRIDVAFELFTKLGVEYYTFHDFDVAPEDPNGDIEQSRKNLEIISDYLLQKQKETGVKLLWATQNLFSNPKYAHGAATAPQLTVFCHAAQQVQTVMDVVHKLDGAGHVFWGGREGYQTLLNTDIKQECDHMAAMYRMAIDYKERKKYTAQFLLEPKPREPMKHQYDYDAQTTMAFLYHYNLQDHFRLNIEPNHTTLAGHAAEHDVAVASAFNMLGSIDSNTGDPLLGWDTDQFPMDLQQTTAVMSYVVKMGGFAKHGGLNFDAKVRRESIEPRDIFIAHIGAMDCYALGLRKAIAMMEAGTLQKMVDERYLSWTKNEDGDSDLGQRIVAGKATLEECAEYAKTHATTPVSSKQELFEMVRNKHLYT